jgi:hypothetical protein
MKKLKTQVWSTKMSNANHSHFTSFAPSAVIQPVAESIAEFNGRAFTGWMEINREWTAFLARRLQEDAALIHRLAACSNPQGIYGIYATFFEKAFADYQCEFTEMLQLGRAGRSAA